MKRIIYILLIACMLHVSCTKNPDLGVSSELAILRKSSINNVKYDLNFIIPRNSAESIKASEIVQFEVDNSNKAVAIDFRCQPENLISIKVNGKKCAATVVDGHINIAASYLIQGVNKVNIEFVAGDQSLNRKAEFLYSLLVPDRASTVFPCFDQPDMKAIFSLSLRVPSDWKAVANAQLISSSASDSTCTYQFDKTQPISTYLFAFAAGKFQIDSCSNNGRKISMYYRETDTDKVQRNREVIFQSHFHSLQWLEDYTGIPYPFQKLDIVLIPDFQYGGMEHAGCIFYNEGRLMLDQNPTENQLLNQANLIAHEVSHQWFGNLVTMKWFDDVWLKEVFAGLMADKIVNPQYPQINHELGFVLSHFPRAYSIDRTAGANAIGQELNNLLLAGTLYGDIIYHKAPIAFEQLELLLGQNNFRIGLQKYLHRFYMSNANWTDLVSILDSLTDDNLLIWSKSWINSTGMPLIQMKMVPDSGLSLAQNGTMLPMLYSIYADGQVFPVNHTSSKVLVEEIAPETSEIQLNYNGKGYGIFQPDSMHLASLLNTSNIIDNAVARASNLLNAHELFLNGKIEREVYFNYLLHLLKVETEPQIRSYISGNIEIVYWRFMQQEQRLAVLNNLESTLYNLIFSSELKPSERRSMFYTYSRIVQSEQGVGYVFDVWRKSKSINGVNLSETDYVNLAFNLAIRDIPQTDSVLAAQKTRILNPDRLEKYRFVERAVNSNEQIRKEFIQSLEQVQNRRPEQWVLEALRYFNHPLRTNFAIDYLEYSLNLLPEIQRTGDIFFPKSWVEAALWGHSSKQALQIVNLWLHNNSDVSPNLQGKLLQSADLLVRVNKLGYAN